MAINLNRLEKASLIITFIDKLKEYNSWGGETHVQKAMYFLQHLTHLDLDYSFILYKHGPYSFDFHDQLTEMFSEGLMDNEIINSQYGPSLVPTASGKRIRDHFASSIKQYHNQMDFIANHLGDKNVVELERMGTALYVTLDGCQEDVESRAGRIIELKPHIKIEKARQAVQNVDRMRRSFEQHFSN